MYICTYIQYMYANGKYSRGKEKKKREKEKKKKKRKKELLKNEESQINQISQVNSATDHLQIPALLASVHRTLFEPYD